MRKGTSHFAFALLDTRFLPKAVFNQFMADYGKDATDEFWKYGIFFTHESQTEVFAECKFNERKIVVFLQQEDAQISRELLNKLLGYHENHTHLCISVDQTHWVMWADLQKAQRLGHQKVDTIDEKTTLEVKDFEFLLGPKSNPDPIEQPPDRTKIITEALEAIEASSIPKVFELLDALRVYSNAYNSLKNEFISGTKDREYIDRLRVFIASLKNEKN
ncbi:MAG: hypothetical protein NW226_11200 [Microscillaceae bacterium]|nr:hypothetical protein [Microscillaceae bacterium]